MAARKRRTQLDPTWKTRIQTSMLVNRLNQNALGLLPVEMTAGQIKSAEVLLRKVTPDLSSVEQVSEITHNYVARTPATLTPDAWLQQRALPQKTLQ